MRPISTSAIPARNPTLKDYLRKAAADVLAIRPDFYLPEFDLYIEYWGMDTEEYVDNMRKKQFHYQLSRYVPKI